MKLFLPTTLFCLLVISPVWAGYYEGLAAARQGDYSIALHEWRPLATKGYAPAQYNLGQMYRKGVGVRQNYAEAMTWYRRAAVQGYVYAQHNLSVMYYKGDGVARDYGEAVRWSRLAAAQGYAKAQYTLGFMYAEGQGVPQDTVKAYMWWILAKRHADAVLGRKIFAKKMTPAQIDEAQALACKWWAKHGEGDNVVRPR